MPGNLQPLDQQFAIVDAQGRPTLYFIQWAQQRQIDITDGIDQATAQALINARTGLTVLYILASGIAGTNVGPILQAPRSGSLTNCQVIVKTSDPVTDLTFTINQNGVPVFTASNVVPHGSAADTLLKFTNLTSVPLAVAQGDQFTIDISTGTSTWQATVILE